MTDSELAWGIVAVVAGAFAFVSKPHRLFQKKVAASEPAPTAVPLRGETWANRWGYSFYFESFSAAGHYVVVTGEGKKRTLAPELWPELVREMSLTNQGVSNA